MKIGRFGLQSLHSLAMIVVVMLMTSCGCGKAVTVAPSNSESTDSTSPTSYASLGSTKPVFHQGQFLLAGQPDKADFAVMKESGIHKVISIRDPKEISWDERAEAEAAGLEFVQIPMGSPDQMTDEKIGQVCRLLREAAQQDQIVVLHCGAAVRAAAVWMAYHCVEESANWEQSEAKVAGMLNLPNQWKVPAKRFVDSKSSPSVQN